MGTNITNANDPHHPLWYPLITIHKHPVPAENIRKHGRVHSAQQEIDTEKRRNILCPKYYFA